METREIIRKINESNYKYTEAHTMRDRVRRPDADEKSELIATCEKRCRNQPIRRSRPV